MFRLNWILLDFLQILFNFFQIWVDFHKILFKISGIGNLLRGKILIFEVLKAFQELPYEFVPPWEIF